MPIHEILLLTATLLCGLTSGLVLAFMVVVMPGLGTLPDREYLGAFKSIDRVIQNNSPLFVIVWAGSVVALLAAAIMNYSVLEGSARQLLIGSVAVYLLGVQLPTFVVNVPLNNRLQSTDLDALDPAGLAESRSAFEPRWVFWNIFRTVLGIVATVLLLAI